MRHPRLTSAIAALALLTTPALALLAGPALAAEHPDIAGTWILDAPKSDFGTMPAPADLTFTIKAQGDEFSVLQTGGGQPDLDLHFNTSGKEVVNQLPGGPKMTSTHHWEGAVLVGVIAVAGDDGGGATFKDRISYSPDGKVMTLERAISSPMGDGQLKMVLNRK